MKQVSWFAVPLALAVAGCIPVRLESGPAGQKEKTVQEKTWANLVDQSRAAKAVVVLRVQLLQAEGGDKFGWDKVKVLGVIKNESGHDMPAEMEVAHYSAEPGVPKGESTIYLERYNQNDPQIWRLLEGSGRQGVSHASAGSGSR